MSRADYPVTRMRRNRMKAFSRRLVAENSISIDDLIWPLFVIEGTDSTEAVASMPGVNRWSIDHLVEQAGDALLLGIPAIAIFPSIDPAQNAADRWPAVVTIWSAAPLPPSGPPIQTLASSVMLRLIHLPITAMTGYLSMAAFSMMKPSPFCANRRCIRQMQAAISSLRPI